MKTINIYYANVTKTSVANISVEDNVDIEDVITVWMRQGYAKAHTSGTDKVFVYIPWTTVVYCSYDR